MYIENQMPKDNSLLPNDNNQQAVVTPPPVLEDVVLPPMINKSDMPAVNNDEPKQSSGSAAPTDDVIMPTTPISSNPRKKFAGGKVIATILGLFLLVGGLGAGVMLTQQNQNVNEKAGSCSPTKIAGGNGGGSGSVDSAAHCPPGADVSNGCDPNNGGGEPITPPTSISDDCFCGVIQIDHSDGTFESWQGDACGGSGGGEAVKVCTYDRKNCPPGTTRGDEVISTYDISAYQLTQCDNTLGSAQTLGACVNEVYDTDQGFNVCKAYAVYNYLCDNLCPDGSAPACTDVPGSNYTTNTSCYHPTTCPNGDTYVSHVNGGPAAGTCYIQSDVNDSDYGNPVYNTVTTCTTMTRTCSCGTPPPTPTQPAITAQCQNVKAYSTNNWTLLTPAVLSTLNAGDSVNFCVTGSATGGSFNKAKFTINGIVQADTTTKRPSSEDFCQLYVIPAGVSTFNVSAQINHVTLGWK